MLKPLAHARRAPALLLAAGVMLAASPAWSAVFCVDTASELEQAMQTAGSNGEDDEIRIKSGLYPSPELLPFLYSVDGSFDLELSGGWEDFGMAVCVLRSSDPQATRLDGENLRDVMSIQGEAGESGQVVIEDLAIIRAQTDAVSSGLRIFAPEGFAGEVLIDGLQFSGNQGPFGGSALRITGGNKVTVRNSLFAFNFAGDGTGIAKVGMAAWNRGVYFINNTFVFSTHDLDPVGSTSASALQIVTAEDGQNQSRAYVANNLFWANESRDIWISPNGTSYVYNNNFSFPYTGGDINLGNLSVDPQLVQLGVDFTPAAGSPMIDQGRPEPTPPFPFPIPFNLDWSYGATDFYDGVTPRVNGDGVDIGAVESPFRPDMLFQDRFEP
jgi:hypothetical protein